MSEQTPSAQPPSGSAATAVVVMASGDPELLRDAVADALAQTAPHTTVVALPEGAGDHLAALLPDDVVVVHGPGTAARRNAALDAVPGAEVVVFLDDDAVPRPDHTEQVVRFLAANPDVVALTGRVLGDGSTGTPLTREEALRALTASQAEAATGGSRPADDVYAHAFAVRRVLPDGTCLDGRFDERLPGPGWLDAVDAARRLTRHGRLVHAADPKVVVLGTTAARSRADSGAERRLGYAQVANPLHLRSTGSFGAKDAAVRALRPVVANLAGAVRGEDRPWRRQRLRGNLRALADVLGGRVDPGRA